MIYLFLASIILTACAVEFYKKYIRGVLLSATELKTKAGRLEIYTVAGILSMGTGWLFCRCNNYTTIYEYIIAVGLIYFLQYLVDMTLLKKAVNSIIQKMAGR